MNTEVLGKIADNTGRGLAVLIEIRDLLHGASQDKPTQDKPTQDKLRQDQPKKTLTTARVIKRLPGMTRENFKSWLKRHPDLRALADEQGRGRSLLWDDMVFIWFEAHRDEKGRYRD